MESAIRGRSTAAADAVVDDCHRRFNPSHPPPHGGGAADPAPPADMATLSFKREVLLQELHKVRILQEMFMRELTQTEWAIAAATGKRSSPTSAMAPRRTPGRDAWRCRLSTQASREEQASETETPWWARSPSDPPPVYPHVERTPSPVRQQPAGNAEQQQRQERGGPSGPPAVAPPARTGLTRSQPLIKDPVTVEEPLIPALANAIAKPKVTGLLSKKAAQEHQAAAGHEREAAKGKNSNGVQLQVMGSGIHITSEHPEEHAAVGKEPKTEPMDDGHAVQLMEQSGIQSSKQSKPAEPTTELSQSLGQSTLGGKEKSTSDEQKSAESNETKPKITPSWNKRRLLKAPRIPSREKRLKPGERSSGTLSPVTPSAFGLWDLAPHREREAQLHWPSQPMPQKPAEPATRPAAPESFFGASFFGAHFQQQSSAEKKSQNQNQNVPPGAVAGGFGTFKWSGDIGQAGWGSGFDLGSHTVLGGGGGRRQDQSAVVGSGSSQPHAEGGGGGGGSGDKEHARRAYDNRKAEHLRKALAGKMNWTRQHVCHVCGVHCTSEKTLELHFGGKRHREMVLQGRR